MLKPVILTVDDDPAVLQAVARDLRQQYGDRFRIVRADSGASALDTTQQLKLRNEAIALFLVDQRMPQMSGVEFLEQASDIFPEAKRVLLTAYADTNAAIAAINTARLDYYLLKPWDPPQEKLYPALDDLLNDWQANFKPEFQGVKVISDRWSPQSHNIRDFLARNQIPYRWLDIETNPEAQKFLEYAGEKGNPCLPLVILPDGTKLVKPSITDIAGKVGLQTEAEKPFYDLAIIGGGPAGLAAAVYGASEGLRTVMIEKEAPGGQAGTSSRIENYLGFPVGLSGSDLARRGVTQAKRFGVEILTPLEATGIRIENNYRIITLSNGSEISCHALILAMGVAWRRLNVKGIDQFTGSGVYYGAAQTEASACQNEEVYIVGGANSAGQAAMYFSKYASKVRMLVRGESLTKSMSQYLIDQIAGTPNIEVLPYHSVVEVRGGDKLEEIVVNDSQTGQVKTFATSSLFIFIGATPSTEWLGDLVQKDNRGFVKTGLDIEKTTPWQLERDRFLLETNIAGIFAVGDVRHGSVKRVASGVGEGSICVQFVHQHLANV
ncbi:fused response regulator/thioredoxin-disulfide reductase [Pseudanabaena sp. SR411]|uniref:FAD-dependent oxidoreductase n=1 Tax=Pseudanabaena sp. SR411 TaxID=1980935 RepID=UPI000B984551|nr:FAD-dependent oxidoreductase [Pseudanabaena sp. SR411]OYQ61952.1 fused response regulator/thioredoxin-disulfide reductase [Pseudanabaena sp. SR411]